MARNLRPTLRHNLERRLKVVFDTIDADSDGFLTQDEVERMGKELGRELQDMLSAVRYLHGKRILHRDLKPENLLYKDAAPGAPLKVIDFARAVLMG